MLDEYDTDKSWPAGLPEKLHEPLDRIAALVAEVREQQGRLLPSDKKRDARRIGKNAMRLLDSVRTFEKDYFPVFNVANHRDSAIERFKDGFDMDLGEEELAQLRAGMDPYSLQWPLFGLRFLMEAIAATKSEDGPRKAVTGIYRHAVRETARLFERAGIPVNGKDRALFLGTCKTVLARAGHPTTDAKIDHYARKLGGAKS